MRLVQRSSNLTCLYTRRFVSLECILLADNHVEPNKRERERKKKKKKENSPFALDLLSSNNWMGWSKIDPNLPDDGGEIPESQGRGWRQWFESWLQCEIHSLLDGKLARWSTTSWAVCFQKWNKNNWMENRPGCGLTLLPWLRGHCKHEENDFFGLAFHWWEGQRHHVTGSSSGSSCNMMWSEVT